MAAAANLPKYFALLPLTSPSPKITSYFASWTSLVSLGNKSAAFTFSMTSLRIAMSCFVARFITTPSWPTPPIAVSMAIWIDSAVKLS